MAAAGDAAAGDDDDGGDADAGGPEAALDQLDVGEYSVVTLDGGDEAAVGDGCEVSWRVASKDELRELLKGALATKTESAAAAPGE